MRSSWRGGHSGPEDSPWPYHCFSGRPSDKSACADQLGSASGGRARWHVLGGQRDRLMLAVGVPHLPEPHTGFQPLAGKTQHTLSHTTHSYTHTQHTHHSHHTLTYTHTHKHTHTHIPHTQGRVSDLLSGPAAVPPVWLPEMSLCHLCCLLKNRKAKLFPSILPP